MGKNSTISRIMYYKVMDCLRMLKGSYKIFLPAEVIPAVQEIRTMVIPLVRGAVIDIENCVDPEPESPDMSDWFNEKFYDLTEKLQNYLDTNEEIIINSLSEVSNKRKNNEEMELVEYDYRGIQKELNEFKKYSKRLSMSLTEIRLTDRFFEAKVTDRLQEAMNTLAELLSISKRIISLFCKILYSSSTQSYYKELNPKYSSRDPYTAIDPSFPHISYESNIDSFYSEEYIAMEFDTKSWTYFRLSNQIKQNLIGIHLFCKKYDTIKDIDATKKIVVAAKCNEAIELLKAFRHEIEAIPEENFDKVMSIATKILSVVFRFILSMYGVYMAFPLNPVTAGAINTTTVMLSNGTTNLTPKILIYISAGASVLKTLIAKGGKAIYNDIKESITNCLGKKEYEVDKSVDKRKQKLFKMIDTALEDLETLKQKFFYD